MFQLVDFIFSVFFDCPMLPISLRTLEITIPQNFILLKNG